MELEPKHRRGGDAARGRDGDRLAQTSRGADSPRAAARAAGRATKIAATAANDNWKPASRSVYGFQASSTNAASSRKCQRSRCRAVSHASEPSAPTTPARTTDGCAPDGEDVAGDAGERAELPNSRGTPSSGGEHEHADGDEGDVLTRDGEQVVEAGGAEPVSQRFGDGLVVAEHDAREDRAALAGAPRSSGRSTRARRRSATPPRPPRRPTRAPAVGAQHDVDALAAQPRSLVEAVVGTARLLDRDDAHSDRALRRRATAAAARAARPRATRRDAEARDQHRHAEPVPARPRRRRHLERRALCRADGGGEDAAVERGEAHAPPPPARAARARAASDGQPPRVGRDAAAAAQPTAPAASADRDGKPRGVRGRESEAQGGDEGDAERARSRRHQLAELVEACRADARDRVELVDAAECAVLLPVVEDLLRRDRPDAGSASSCSTVAVFRCTGPAGADGPQRPAAAPRARATARRPALPSASGAARLTSVELAFRVAPPARARASAMRDPAAGGRAPGRRTAPTTSTTTSRRGVAGAGAAARRCGRLVRRPRVAQQAVRERQRKRERERAERRERDVKPGCRAPANRAAGEPSRVCARFSAGTWLRSSLPLALLHRNAPRNGDARPDRAGLPRRRPVQRPGEARDASSSRRAGVDDEARSPTDATGRYAITPDGRRLRRENEPASVRHDAASRERARDRAAARQPASTSPSTRGSASQPTTRLTSLPGTTIVFRTCLPSRCAAPARTPRALDQLRPRAAGVDLEAVAHLAVHLHDELERLALEQRLGRPPATAAPTAARGPARSHSSSATCGAYGWIRLTPPSRPRSARPARTCPSPAR